MVRPVPPQAQFGDNLLRSPPVRSRPRTRPRLGDGVASTVRTTTIGFPVQGISRTHAHKNGELVSAASHKSRLRCPPSRIIIGFVVGRCPTTGSLNGRLPFLPNDFVICLMCFPCARGRRKNTSVPEGTPKRNIGSRRPRSRRGPAEVTSSGRGPHIF